MMDGHTAAWHSQQVQELPHGGPLGRILAQGRGHRVAQGWVQRCHIRFAVHHTIGDHVRRAVTERSATAGREGHDPAPGEHVRGRAHAVAHVLFGCHVTAGSQHHAGRRQPGGRLQRPGDPEIDHPGAHPGQQDVARLEITVDEPHPVDRGQRGGHRDRELVELGLAQRTAGADRLVQRGAVDVLGHQVRRLRGDVDVENLRGAEPGHPAGVLTLVAEAEQELLVPGVAGGHDLHRDQSTVGRLPEMDHAHAALAQAAQHPVPADVLRIPGHRPHPGR